MTQTDIFELQARYRDVMAGVPTAVSVVTATVDGRPHGTTVSAFASLSMSPPMVVVCLDQASDLLALLRRARNFGVNVLAADQATLATAFAAKGKGKFDGVGWTDDAGLPRLKGCAAWLACEVSVFFDGGDHVIVLGRVAVAERCDCAPLTYQCRVFGTHAALEAAV